MPQAIRQRRLTTVAYNAGNKQTERLSRGMIYREIYLKLTMGLTAAVGNAITNANTEAGDEWAIIDEIRIIANGSDVLRRFSGEELRWLNFFMFHVPPRVPLAPGVAADSTLSIESALIIPFWSPNAIRPIDTALDSRRLSSLEIEVTWSSGVSAITSATSASFGTNPSLEVYSLESFGVDGEFAQTHLFRIQETSVAVQDQFQIDIPVGAVYRGFFVNTKDNTPADLANAITNIKLVSGTTVFLDMDASLLRDVSLLRNSRRILHDDAGGAEDAIFASADSNVDAWYHINLVTDGRLMEAVDTIGLAEIKLEFEVGTAIETLTVIPDQIIPVRGGG